MYGEKKHGGLFGFYQIKHGIDMGHILHSDPGQVRLYQSTGEGRGSNLSLTDILTDRLGVPHSVRRHDHKRRHDELEIVDVN